MRSLKSRPQRLSQTPPSSVQAVALSEDEETQLETIRTDFARVADKVQERIDGEPQTHRIRGQAPIKIKARTFYVRCEDNDQLYECPEGIQPVCPECNKLMRYMGEVK